jgi:hypothetical protein
MVLIELTGNSTITENIVLFVFYPGKPRESEGIVHGRIPGWHESVWVR